MIFEEMRLYNFGIYQGHHTITLDSPEHKKPIILIGALNGAGKTTFLDALQLALYGKYAKCSNRGRLGYLNYLEKNINSFSEDRSASITLRFRHGDNKKNPQVYEVERSWKKNGQKECKEYISVSFNGVYDQIISDNWEEFVNEFIPQSISELFFFDGEKIENFADPKRAAELLKTGIEALLGLELLSTLATDLNELKRKKQEKLLNQEDTSDLNNIKEKIASLNNKKDELTAQLTIAKESVKVEEESYFETQKKLFSSGADKLSLKESFEKEKTELTQKLFTVKHELLKLAASTLPLGLTEQLLYQAEKQAICERKANIFEDAKDLLKQQRMKFLSIVADTMDDATLSLVQNKLSESAEKEYQDNQIFCYLKSNPIYFSGVIERISEEKNTAISLLNKKREIEESIILVERKISTIPTLDSVKELIHLNAKQEEKLEKTKSEKEILARQLAQILDDINVFEGQYNSLLIKRNTTLFEHKRQSQITNHIDTLKEIIISFNKQLVIDNITKLERKIKAKFDLLKRKDSLISHIKIDPTNFSMTLFATNHIEMPAERLSAGERQLLAISILWGLADSSGKELPTIIDTPMGRLDGEHRTRLIKQYFPYAASQVILLSTDEEIYGQYYNELKPFIAQEYHISYDEVNKSSYFSKGYLESAI